MAVNTPPRPPAPTPPRHDDLEALIKEARRRQRKRRAMTAAVVLSVAAIVTVAYSIARRGTTSSTGTHARSSASAPVTTRFAVAASSFRRPRWSGLVIADPVDHSCTRVPLPHSRGYILFAGDRYAYQPDGVSAVWLGTVGRGGPLKLVLPFRAMPSWLGGQLALTEVRAPMVHVGARTIRLAVPRGAEIGNLVGSRGRILFDGSWGNGRRGTFHNALFLYANGVTRKIREDAEPLGARWFGSASWSPDGSKIAFADRGDVWTSAPDGTSAVRLTRSPNIQKRGPLLWSPGGRTIAYSANQRRLAEVYVVPADGSGRARRLTRSSFVKKLEPPVDEGGTVPLAWLGRDALAVLGGNSLGVLRTGGGPARAVCTIPTTSLGNATALR